MAEMYDHLTCSSPPPPPLVPSAAPPCPPLVEADKIPLFLHHLLQSSASSSLCISSDRAKRVPFSSPSPDDALPPPLFSTSTTRLYESLLETHLLPCGSALATDSDCRVRDGSSTAESSAAVYSSSLIFSSSGFNLKEAASTTSAGAVDYDAATASAKWRKASTDDDIDDDDCESEEDLEVPSKPVPLPPRSSSKRSRAAEVHNLSEKRRRSRINEKMKALLNLIPNSNKTDKASMLDEAIEYLKQLQLKVQMLSMRNGLSLHPKYLPEVLQSTQLPQMQIGSGNGERSLHMNVGTGTLPVNQETSTRTAFSPSNQHSPLQKPVVLHNVTNITYLESLLGMDLPVQTHHGPFHLSTDSEEFYREGLSPQQPLDMRYPARDLSENQKPMTTTTLPSDAPASVLPEPTSLEACILHKEVSQEMLSKDLHANRMEEVPDESKMTSDY